MASPANTSSAWRPSWFCKIYQPSQPSPDDFVANTGSAAISARQATIPPIFIPEDLPHTAGGVAAHSLIQHRYINVWLNYGVLQGSILCVRWQATGDKC